MENLIINADDFGLSDKVNTAIDICLKNNWIQRTTLMVNMPDTLKAVELSKSGNYIDKVGLHINLIEGVPLTLNIRKTSFCNNIGEFNGKFFKNLKNRFILSPFEKKAVEQEIEEQIKKFISLGFKPNHLDSHQHSHTNISIFFIILKLARKYDFHSIRLSRNIPVKEITGLKKIYKNFINKKIIKFNDRINKNYSKQFFGSKEDCEKENIINNSKYKNISIEMMIHPTIKNGKIIDNFTYEELFNQKNRGENYE